MSGSCHTALNDNGNSRIRRTLRRFLPLLWNVNAATVGEGHGTNNVAEGWNNRFRNLVGHYQLSVCALLEVLQTDKVEVPTAMLKHALGNLVALMRSRAVKQHQQHLWHLCEELPQEAEVACCASSSTAIPLFTDIVSLYFCFRLLCRKLTM